MAAQEFSSIYSFFVSFCRGDPGLTSREQLLFKSFSKSWEARSKHLLGTDYLLSKVVPWDARRLANIGFKTSEKRKKKKKRKERNGSVTSLKSLQSRERLKCHRN